MCASYTLYNNMFRRSHLLVLCLGQNLYMDIVLVKCFKVVMLKVFDMYHNNLRIL